MKLDISELLNKKEDEFLEYKAGFDTEDVASTVASFSTNKGGYILIGVKDDGTPIGYSCSKKDIDAKLYNIAKNMTGGTALINIDYEDYQKGSFIVVIKVFEGDKKPYGWKGVYYNRIGSSDEKLTPEQITDLTLKSKNLHFDNLTAELFHRKGNINDIDEQKIIDYVSNVRKGKRNKQIDFNGKKPFLQNFNLIIDNYIKNAAVLLFGKNTQEFFPSSKINFLIYSGEEIDNQNLKRRIIFDGDLITQINDVFNLIKLNTENRIVMEGLKRIEISQYPLEAIREALINAVVHRDYSISNADIIIRLFDNKLEIINPGGLIEGVNLQQLIKGGHHSVKRNPTICFLLDNLGYMEQSGNGIKSMINSMKHVGLLEPTISADKDSFKIEFYGQNITKPGSKPLIGLSTDFTPFLTDSEKGGLSAIKNLSDEFVMSEYMQKTGIKNRITAKKHLTNFENMGLLKTAKKGKFLVYRKIASLK